jgi:transposase
VHLVKMACELPEQYGCSLSQWDCRELARKLVADGVVEQISPQTVGRILNHHKLKPWRKHLWLSPKVPRDEAFAQTVQAICDLYTRALQPYEMVVCVDEKTSLQPRTRKHPTRPAQPGLPVRVEHEYHRVGKGALHLFAGFDTRSGKVWAITRGGRRQAEFIEFLTHLNQHLPRSKTCVHIVLDNLPVHHGQLVKAWLEAHPRFVLHFLPVHCSWMNQVEQWFGILQRKRLSITDFPDQEALATRLMEFVAHWNAQAHPFHWTTGSVAKIMAKCEPEKIAA